MSTLYVDLISIFFLKHGIDVDTYKYVKNTHPLPDVCCATSIYMNKKEKGLGVCSAKLARAIWPLLCICGGCLFLVLHAVGDEESEASHSVSHRALLLASVRTLHPRLLQQHGQYVGKHGGPAAAGRQEQNHVSYPPCTVSCEHTIVFSPLLFSCSRCAQRSKLMIF